MSKSLLEQIQNFDTPTYKNITLEQVEKAFKDLFYDRVPPKKMPHIILFIKAKNKKEARAKLIKILKQYE